MNENEIVQEWIEKAEEDFGFASLILEQTDYFAQVCFHFQQAAEKYLKAFIIANNLQFRAIHNLLELLNICRAQEPGIAGLEEACRYLNPIYIDTRYPVHWPTHYDRETATQARNSAESIKNWVISFLARPHNSEQECEQNEVSESPQ
jgi:HEPN domain-containing protein